MFEEKPKTVWFLISVLTVCSAYYLLVSIAFTGGSLLVEYMWGLILSLIVVTYFEIRVAALKQRAKDENGQDVKHVEIVGVEDLVKKELDQRVKGARAMVLAIIPVLAILIALPTAMLPFAVRSWTRHEAQKEFETAGKQIEYLTKKASDADTSIQMRLGTIEATLAQASRLSERVGGALADLEKTKEQATSAKEIIEESRRDGIALQALYEQGVKQHLSNQTIVIGGKNNLVSSVLTEVLAQIILDSTPSATVERRRSVGDSLYTIQALDRGRIHLSVDYSGTILSQYETGITEYNIFTESNHLPVNLNGVLSETTFSNVRVIADLGFEDSYIMAVSKKWLEDQKINLKVKNLTEFHAALKGLTVEEDEEKKA